MSHFNTSLLQLEVAGAGYFKIFSFLKKQKTKKIVPLCFAITKFYSVFLQAHSKALS